MIVEIQRAVSAADQDRIIGAPAGGRRAIASKAVSTCVKPIRDFEFSLILIVGKVIQGSRLRPIWSHVRPNLSRVRLKKI